LFGTKIDEVLDKHLKVKLDVSFEKVWSLQSKLLDAEGTLQDIPAKLDSISNGLSLIPERIESVTNSLAATAEESSGVLQEASKGVNDAVNELYEVMRDCVNNGPPIPESYAAIAAEEPIRQASIPAPVPPPQLAKANLQARRVLIDKAAGVESHKLAGLNEQQVVERCKRALAFVLPSIEEHQQPDYEVSVVSALRLRNGGILVEFDCAESANLIRRFAKEFGIGLGGTSVVKAKEWATIAEYVPVSHNPESAEERSAIEYASDLPQGSIASTKWIKPLSRRSPSQQNAHLIVRFSSTEAANKALCDGLIICYRRVRLRKLGPEPRRCLKCQKFTSRHSAATCPEVDTCATCGGSHRSSSCTVQESKEYYCSNCKQKGHASWSKDCPIYKQEAEKANQRSGNQAAFKFFPDSEEWTWQTVKGAKDSSGNPQMPEAASETEGFHLPRRHSWFDEAWQEQEIVQQKKAAQASRASKGKNGWGAKASEDPTPSATTSERQTQLPSFFSRPNSTSPELEIVRSSVTPDPLE
jgi:hypothetical protein